MITLYAAGPAYGLPEGSPHVTKTEIHLKMAGLLVREGPDPSRDLAQGPAAVDRRRRDQGRRLHLHPRLYRAQLRCRPGRGPDQGPARPGLGDRADGRKPPGLGQLPLPVLRRRQLRQGPARWFDGMPGEARADAIDGLLGTVQTSPEGRRHGPPFARRRSWNWAPGR